MKDAGYFAVSRKIFEHDFFAREPFTEVQAWLWLIKEAAWRPTSVRLGNGRFDLERGQCATSTRFLATAWGWSHSRVVRYLERLEAENMIRRRSGTAATRITICNYDEYQGGDTETGTAPDRNSDGSKIGTLSEHSSNCNRYDNGNDISETGTLAKHQPEQTRIRKPLNQEEKEEDVTADAVSPRYAFEGKTIKLNQKNFDQWVEAHPNLSLMSELFALDQWAGLQKAAGKSWFNAVAGALAKKQRDINERVSMAKANREAGGGARPRRDGRI